MQADDYKAPREPDRLKRIFKRVFSFLLFAFLIACLTSFVTTVSNRQTAPAGFLRGILHGALMPGALVNLAVGNDVIIYAPNNTGRTYKLGYTVGVNGCGAVFFGGFFLRYNRWRKRTQQAQPP